MARAVSPTSLNLVTNEYRFCQWAKYRGIREAFLTHLSGDAVVFKPRPTNGRAWFLRTSDIPGHLTWRPLYVESSTGNDLGYTTGPWVYTSPGESLSHGHYVTFWRRLPNLGWRVILDVGTEHLPLELEAEIAYHHSPLKENRRRLAREQRLSVRDRLLHMDKSFSDESEGRGFVEALAAIWSEDVRLYRMGKEPAIGKQAAMKAVQNKTGVMSLTPGDGIISTVGDLGFTHGVCRFESHRRGHAEHGSYLRAWRNDGADCWRVVLDLVIPIPSEEAAYR